MARYRSHDIKQQLLDLKAAGELDQVRMLLLTNCTFDGIVYNVERVMEECLAIKPDLVFLWDEAWFAFASFSPTYRQRTAMHCAETLRHRYRSEAYRETYQKWLKTAPKDDKERINARLMPDPDKVRVRVYATQSTHKTLTSLRQGSMIHVNDQDFKGEVEQAFREAYMTHTSTSPNYQIIASLDVGRRQVELEGFEFVQKQIEAAMVMRRAISTHPLLKKYFEVLAIGDMVPERYRSAASTSTGMTSTAGASSGMRGRGRIRARPNPGYPHHRPHRHRRQHLQEPVPDGQIRNPDQQDFQEYRAVHDQYRHDPIIRCLSDRGVGQDRTGY